VPGSSPVKHEAGHLVKAGGRPRGSGPGSG
jgi:hypothetical protein